MRALPGFGAPGAIRVTAGTDEENEVFGEALGACGAIEGRMIAAWGASAPATARRRRRRGASVRGNPRCPTRCTRR